MHSQLFMFYSVVYACACGFDIHGLLFYQSCGYMLPFYPHLLPPQWYTFVATTIFHTLTPLHRVAAFLRLVRV